MKKLYALLLTALTLSVNAQTENVAVKTGTFGNDWESLSQWECPEWFKDAKFGIWAHWGPQCQAEDGDWYARFMYYEGSSQYNYHVDHFGNPSTFGLKELCNAWKADQWNPQQLVSLYKSVGARYFMALGNHHDNFDNWNSPYQEWNSVNVGPKKDLIGGWAEACKAEGLPLGVSIHASHAWTWLEPSQRFDGNLTRADGKGQWWEGLDPQELYAQNHAHSTGWERSGTIHSQWDWGNGASLPSQAYKQKFQNRVLELINDYDPDIIYFDDTAMPFYGCDDQIGKNILQHYYNHSAAEHNGRQQVVVTGKQLTSEQKDYMMWDVERGVPDRPQAEYWQTCTCIGQWHYDQNVYRDNRYKSGATVVRMLIDVVSKNGNLLLSIPVRGNGTIDDKELQVLADIKAWMDINGESIYGTRTWKTFGEGPLAEAANPMNAQGFNEGQAYSAQDVRYVQKNGVVYATIMAWPAAGEFIFKALGMASYSGDVEKVELLGYDGDIAFEQDFQGLRVIVPSTKPNAIAPVFKVTFKALGLHSLTGRGRGWVLVSALPDEAWRESEWICVADAPEVTGRVDDHTRAADGASWFFSTIRNEQKVTKALWMTTSLGVNDLYVNGERIGNEVLRPGFSHHSRTKYSFTYDITRQFHKKKGQRNNLEAQVTPGWWADKIITPSGSNGMYGQKCAFRGVLELTFADGSIRRYGTNTKDWRAGIAGPVTHAAIFDGEEYDARIPAPSSVPSVSSAFSAPAVSREYVGVIVPENGAEVYHLTELALNPKRAYVYSTTEGTTDDAYGKIVIDREYDCSKASSLSGRAGGDAPMVVRPGEHLVVDFGQNCAAVPSFRFKAKEGTRLSCLPAELLNDGNGAKSRGMDGPEGSVHRRNLRSHEKNIRLDYTFAGFAHYVPRATFFGYRYVDITATDEVVIERIQSIPVSSITPEMETGHITTGNELVNQLISNTRWGMRSNYLSVPTDCPQRNERLGWTADTQVFCETGTFFANTRRFFHKWMRDMRDTQSPQGGYPGVAPAAQYGANEHDYMRVGWADAGIIVPWTIWKQYGDASIIEECWESMTRFMNHINATKYDHVALSSENGNYQWADWLSYEPLESCGGGAFKDGQPLPEAIDYWNYLCASYWAMDAAMMRDMAKATGRNAAEYDTMANDAKRYLREQFFNTDGTFKTPVLNTMQTPALFALRNNLFDGEPKNRMIERLRENFRQHNDCLQTGFLGTSILMPTLTDNGMADIAYTLLFQRKNPSWLYSIDNGATTIWERWNSYTKENGMGPQGMNSFNHYAYGVVCQWLWQTSAGIASDPAAPGFQHIIMRPVPDRRLGHLDATYRIPSNGLIESHWHYAGDEWIWTFTIPTGTTASVTLPGDNTSKEYQPGTYTITKTIQ